MLDRTTPSTDLIVRGDVVVKDNTGVTRIRLDSDSGSISGYNKDGDIVFQWEMPGNNLRFGGHKQDGDLVIFAQEANSISDTSNSTFHFNSQNGQALVGGGGIAGKIVVQNKDREPRILLDGANGKARVGAIEFPDGSTQVTAAKTSVITGVTAGNGLSGGGGSGNVTLSISPDLTNQVQGLGSSVQELASNVQALASGLQVLQSLITSHNHPPPAF